MLCADQALKKPIGSFLAFSKRSRLYEPLMYNADCQVTLQADHEDSTSTPPPPPVGAREPEGLII